MGSLSKLFKILRSQHESSNTDNDNTNSEYNNMKYDFAEDEKPREMLNNIINFTGIDIELVGAWIWVSGNTYAHKKALKELGFRWASQKKMWYWHSEAFRKKSRKTLSMDDIRNFYGSTEIKSESFASTGVKFFKRKFPEGAENPFQKFQCILFHANKERG